MIPQRYVTAALAGLEQADAEIRPGYHLATHSGTQADAVARLAGDITAFRDRHGLDHVVVVDISSTEPIAADRPEFHDAALLAAALADPARAVLPSSSIAALAAIESGSGYAGFTPSAGLSLPVLRELAAQRGIPFAGQDGKTGETLIRTALAPMFGARGMHVSSWAGANLLGGGDGATLADPEAVQSKLASKTRGLRSLVGEHVVAPLHIDNVPDLGDIKTAWDHIHAEGFLGSRITHADDLERLRLDARRAARARPRAPPRPGGCRGRRRRRARARLLLQGSVGQRRARLRTADHRPDRMGARDRRSPRRCTAGRTGGPVTTVGDVLELVRAPAALTVVGDAMAGGYAGGGRLAGRRWLLPLASVFLYSGGMALNDYADRRLDAVERPERPIPSGRIAPRRALGIAAACLAVGLGLAATGGGRRGLAVAVPLVGAIVSYNTVFKETAAGPISMAACRGLDVHDGRARGQGGACPPPPCSRCTRPASPPSPVARCTAARPASRSPASP